MAVVALEKLEAQLNCSVCLDTYTSPKQLHCQHVYCQQCLEKLVAEDQQGQLILTCPSCRQVTPVPASGVAGLQSAFQINRFLDIVEEQKKTKAAEVHNTVLSVSSSIDFQGKRGISCPKHGGREVELYCNTCEEPICFKCIMKNEQHQSHDYEELGKAYERYQDEIMSSLKPLEKQLATIENALAQFDQHHGKISDQEILVEADIHQTFSRLHKTLDARKKELIDQLHQLTQAKIKGLAAQKDQLETTQAQLQSCLLLMRENLKTDNQGEALLRRSTTARQVKDLSATFQQDTLMPNAEADMVFSALTDISTEIQTYGKIVATSVPVPSKSYCYTVASQTVDKSTSILQVLNDINQPCEISVECISCELVSEDAESGEKVNVKKLMGKGQFKITYQPTINVKHQLHVKMSGQHVKGSPFAVCVKQAKQVSGNYQLNLFDKSPMKIISAGQSLSEMMKNIGLDGSGSLLKKTTDSTADSTLKLGADWPPLLSLSTPPPTKVLSSSGSLSPAAKIPSPGSPAKKLVLDSSSPAKLQSALPSSLSTSPGQTSPSNNIFAIGFGTPSQPDDFSECRKISRRRVQKDF